MSDRILIRPAVDAARGEYDRRRATDLKRERAERRADELEAARRALDVIDLELAGLYAIRARQLAVDLGRRGFDTSGLKPLRLPTQLERDARRRRGRPEAPDPVVLQRQREAADNGRIYRHAIGRVIRVR